MEQLKSHPEVLRLQRKLEKPEAMNCELEGDLLDRGDKLAYCQDERNPELIEKNRFLRAQISSLTSADVQIKNCEVQLAAGWEKEEAAELKRQLAEALEEDSRVQGEGEALRVEMEKLRVERNAAEARVDSGAALGFEHNKGLLAVINPYMPLGLVEPKNEVFEGNW